MTLVTTGRDTAAAPADEELVAINKRVIFEGYLVAVPGDRISKSDAERWGALDDAEPVEGDVAQPGPELVAVNERVVHDGYLVAIPGDLVTQEQADAWGINADGKTSADDASSEEAAPVAKKAKASETAAEKPADNAAETPAS